MYKNSVKQICQKIVFALLFSIAAITHAENTRTHWYGTLGGGAQWAQSQSSFTVPNGSQYTAPHQLDLFSVQHHVTGGLFFLSAGRQWKLDRDWFSAYSLGAYYQRLLNHNITGTIKQYSKSEFLNYSYQWGSSTSVVLLSGKLNMRQIRQWSPYLSLGLGVAMNQTQDYSETAFTGVTARNNPSYRNGTSTNFAYQAGLGIDYQLKPAWIISLGYAYQSVGPIQSGPGQSTWVNTHLTLGSLAQNELVGSITYLI